LIALLLHGLRLHLLDNKVFVDELSEHILGELAPKLRKEVLGDQILRILPIPIHCRHGGYTQHIVMHQTEIHTKELYSDGILEAI
jgi:hypothetical protein